MRNALAPLVDAVALFMDNTADEVREAVRQVRPTLLQFHGSEDDAFCRGSGSLGQGRRDGRRSARVDHGAATALPGRGRFPCSTATQRAARAVAESTFNWERWPRTLNKPAILAGGLTPGNIFDAIIATQPWGVDVSSGIESAPGIKDGHLMRMFVEEVRRADCHVEHTPEAVA